MKLFDRDGDGGRELADVIGFISDRIDYSVWEPILPLGVRDVVAIVGREPVEALAEFYMGGSQPSDFYPPSTTTPLHYLRQAVAFFTWLKIIPTLDAQHDTNGRQRRTGENERGLSALEQFKDESNIQRLAYEAVDALIEVLEREQYAFWTDSPKCKLRAGLIIPDKESFDQYFVIGSHRLFVTLLPIICEVQQGEVLPIVGRDLMPALLARHDSVTKIALYDYAARAVALLTMRKAIERLPVEVLPEGIVQINQSTPVNQRIKAERDARNAVAQSLAADAARNLRQLQDAVAELRATDTPVDLHLSKPIAHSRGMSF